MQDYIDKGTLTVYQIPKQGKWLNVHTVLVYKVAQTYCVINERTLLH